MDIAKERMYLTATRERLVEEGHLDAATLYAIVGDQIPASAVKMFGVVDGYLSKAKKQAADKAKPKGEDKSAGRKGGLTIKRSSRRIRKVAAHKAK